MLHADDNLDRIICMHIRAQVPTHTERITDDVMLRFGWGPCITEGCDKWTPDPICEHCLAKRKPLAYVLWPAPDFRIDWRSMVRGAEIWGGGIALGLGVLGSVVWLLIEAFKAIRHLL